MIMVRKEKSGRRVVTKLEILHGHPLGISSGKGRRFTVQARQQDEKDKKIRELSANIYSANQQLAECRQQLETVLKDAEQHTDHLTKSIQDRLENVKKVEEAEDEELHPVIPPFFPIPNYESNAFQSGSNLRNIVK